MSFLPLVTLLVLLLFLPLTKCSNPSDPPSYSLHLLPPPPLTSPTFHLLISYTTPYTPSTLPTVPPLRCGQVTPYKPSTDCYTLFTPGPNPKPGWSGDIPGGGKAEEGMFHGIIVLDEFPKEQTEVTVIAFVVEEDVILLGKAC